MRGRFKLNVFSYLGLSAYALAAILVAVTVPNPRGMLSDPQTLLLVARGPLLAFGFAYISYKLCGSNTMICNLVLAFGLFIASAELCKTAISGSLDTTEQVAAEETPPLKMQRSSTRGRPW